MEGEKISVEIKWLEGCEHHPEYLEKMDVDLQEENLRGKTAQNAHPRMARENAWYRKREFKKRMIRQFLSVDPTSSIDRENGNRASRGIYLASEKITVNYWINVYTRTYVSPKGDVRHVGCAISPAQPVGFSIYKLSAFTRRRGNRMIRRLPIAEDDHLTKESARVCRIMCKKVHDSDSGW